MRDRIVLQCYHAVNPQIIDRQEGVGLGGWGGGGWVNRGVYIEIRGTAVIWGFTVCVFERLSDHTVAHPFHISGLKFVLNEQLHVGQAQSLI